MGKNMIPKSVVCGGETYFSRMVRASARRRLSIARPAAFFERLGNDSNIGMGEAYQARDWDSPDLADLLTVFAIRLNAVPPALQSLRHRVQQVRPASNSNSPAVSRRNTSAHYDLSNELFALFLDDLNRFIARAPTPALAAHPELAQADAAATGVAIFRGFARSCADRRGNRPRPARTQ